MNFDDAMTALIMRFGEDEEIMRCVNIIAGEMSRMNSELAKEKHNAEYWHKGRDKEAATVFWMGCQTDIRGVKDIYEYWDDSWLFDLIHSHEHDPTLREYLVVPKTVADKFR